MAQPVNPDNKYRRSDQDAPMNSFVDVVSGTYAGRYGVLERAATYNTGTDGYPNTVIVRSRDARNELLVCNYTDLRPSVPGKR